MRICEECKHENQPHYRFCLKCGHDLGGAADEPAWVPPTASRTQRCGHCGTKVVDPKAAKCAQCGAPL